VAACNDVESGVPVIVPLTVSKLRPAGKPGLMEKLLGLLVVTGTQGVIGEFIVKTFIEGL